MWFVIGCLALSTGTNGEAQSETVSEVARLKSDKEDVREATAQRIRVERAETIRGLVVLARQDVKPLIIEKAGNVEYVEYPWHDAKHLAILLLGDLRAQEGVAVLLDNLTYRNPRSRLSGGEDDPGLAEGPGWYPAAASLIKIGMPSVGPVTEKLSGYAGNCLERRLCLVVLKGVLGSRLAKAYLEIAIEEAKDETAGANLKAALEQFESKANADR